MRYAVLRMYPAPDERRAGMKRQAERGGNPRVPYGVGLAASVGRHGYRPHERLVARPAVVERPAHRVARWEARHGRTEVVVLVVLAFLVSAFVFE